MRALIPITLFSLALALFGCARKAPSNASQMSTSAVQASAVSTQNHFANEPVPQSCVDAAKKVLGNKAEVVRFGHLSGTDALEAVAIVNSNRFVANNDGMAVSRLAILRLEDGGWKSILDAYKNVTNAEGYVGIDYVDDSTINGYRVSFSDEGKSSFTVDIGYLASNGESEGLPMEISWNPAIGRYQEVERGEDVFKPEIKNPPHK
jgi:hypothetical protein